MNIQFPSTDSLLSGAKLKLIPSKDILRLYNENMHDFKLPDVNHIVMTWFITKAINEYGWSGASICGKCCLLKR